MDSSSADRGLTFRDRQRLFAFDSSLRRFKGCITVDSIARLQTVTPAQVNGYEDLVSTEPGGTGRQRTGHLSMREIRDIDGQHS